MREWEKNIRKVEPYIPGEQPKVTDIIKLNTNENPYPPSPFVTQAVKNINLDRLKLYPDPSSTILVEAIADYYKVTKEEVFVGVGSDDVLAMSFLTFFNSKKPILFPDITYSFYEVWADLFQIPYEKQPLQEDFTINRSDYKKENGGIIIANPNAPTSIYEELDHIEEIVKDNQNSIVIIDEAYIDFGGVSAMELTHTYENLLVVQTFSKSRSMAGMRIGFAVGNKRLIEALNQVKHSYNSYTINHMSLIMGVAAIKDKEYFHTCCERIVKTRENTKQQLEELGFSCLSSKTNFLFVTSESINAKELFSYLKEHKIFVRYFEKPRIDSYLRITIGKEEEMKQLILAIKTYMTS